MIERVHRAARCSWNTLNYVDNLRLDIARLYLDVQGGAPADRLKDFLKRRKRHAWRKFEVLELRQRKGRDCAAGDRGIDSR